MPSSSLLLLCLLTVTDAYKVVIFAPGISNSQLIWNKRVAEVLAKAGHDVTVLKIAPFEVKYPPVNFDSRIRVLDVNASTGLDFAAVEEKQSKVIFQDLSFFDPRSRELFSVMLGSLFGMCEKLVVNSTFLDFLREEKFDIAFTHMYEPCEIGIIHHVGIPSWVWLNSGQLMDYVGNAVGAPAPSSYVPPLLMSAKDTMSFLERVKSFVGHSLMAIIYPKFMTPKTTAIFRKHFGPSFPDINDLCRDAPVVMVNSNELYEYTRPTLHKVIFIGGLGMQFEDASPLTGEYDEVAKEAESLVVFSFGSVANASQMPPEWKDAFLAAFRQFPKTHFFIRYTASDLKDRLPPNVHLSKWLPQRDLLQHPKTKAFISHGGFNSLQESISAGVPLITLALFGDQPRNAELAEHLGISVKLSKSDINEATIAAALREAINNDKYSKKARRLRAMIQAKPIKAEELLIRWTEFAAQFGSLDNLIPHGVHLSFIEYYQIDVVAFLVGAVFLVLFLLVQFIILPCVLVRRCRRGGKKLKTN